MQAYIDAAAERLEVAVIVLSIDVANDPKAGDLSNREAVKALLALVLSGKVWDVIAGPPCETFQQSPKEAAN